MAAHLVVECGIQPDVIERMPIERLVWWVDSLADHYRHQKGQLGK